MKIVNKIRGRIASFKAVRECSNTFIAFKVEILSFFIKNLRKKQQVIQSTKLKCLNKQYGYLVRKYAKQHKTLKCNQPIIWIMWWQGYEKMPPIVKACFRSVNRHTSNNIQIVLLTKENYSDYVKIPRNILEKVEKGMISLTHLSDIIRMACISEHGGVWLDSTIYVTKDIPDSMIFGEFFSLSTTEDCHFVSKCKWSSFAIGGTSVVFDFMKDLFFTHWEKYNNFIDFFFIDYGLRLFYDKVPAFKEVVDKDSIFVENLYELQNCLNDIYDSNELNYIREASMFYKLSWKGKFEVLKDGKKTIYGHLIHQQYE